jgi:hypothetical protein
MTEQEWMAAIPSLMMDYINQVAPSSYRKLRLLAIAWAKFLESQPDYADAKHVSHLGEDVLEGRQTLDDLWDDRRRGWGYDGDWRIANLVLVGDAQLDMAIRKAIYFSEHWSQEPSLNLSQRPVVARSLILCVLGNPFRPVAASPTWQTANVVALAQAIYDKRAFDRMPILADALEDAGCANADILNHCRQPAEHVRGCWVVDLLLGKK